MICTDLDDSLRDDICRYMGMTVQAPTLRHLNRLIHAHTRTVPWESISRILKRHSTSRTSDCPRWPEEFWQDAMTWGTGGTCFESSLAFYTLLRSLGYEAYLTVNDMGTSRACHAAIVALLAGRKYLVDVTMPLYDAIPIESDRVSRRRSFFHDYIVHPQGGNRYRITRSHHPRREAFTLIDIPVPESEYRRIVAADYAETGLFLKSVVIVRIVGDKVWRFFSDLQPYRLESFNR
ncbi:MAG: arylamine N-acetyltransferase, partial [Bacteroidota bacterium]